jgi:pyruvate ferredoxin oxidoreductase alpha subunit
MGSVLGTLKDAIDIRRDAGEKIGALGVVTFRPFPEAALAAALSNATRVVVLEKAFNPGGRGVLASDVALAAPHLPLSSVVAGLGGRPITRASLEALLARAAAGDLAPVTFLDLDEAAVAGERARLAGAS